MTIPNYSSTPPQRLGFQGVTRRKGYVSAASLGPKRVWLTIVAPGSHAAPLLSRDWICLAAAGMAGGCHGGRGCSPASAVAGLPGGRLLLSHGLLEPMGLV
jgi:hypothetical protein